ncbi:MAG: ABC-type dipeptide transport system, periplasmic component [Pseudonocardiales bacterium]|nr:ABC-type dipeptide transport system, periplasmic component [Pseudonocardiales bacterium]
MKRTSLTAVGGALVSLLLLAGCFGGGSKDDGGGAAPSGSIPADAGTPEPGGTFVWNTTTEPPTLDPHKSASALTQLAVSGLVYSKLLEFKTGRDTPYGSMTVQSDLAEKWEHSADAKTWTFTLRKGVKFHNKAPVNGREFTSADVLCTVDRIKNLPGVQKALLEVVDKTTAPDAYTVVFNLKEAYVAFDETVANYYLSILPCEGTRGEFDLATAPIGTGPFILQSWTRDVEKIYVKNPNYFIAGKPYLDGIRMVTMKDPAAQVAAFRAGELDSTGVSDSLLPSVLSSNPNAQVRLNMGTYQGHIVMNQSVKPFDDYRVRKAVSLAFDRQGMGESLSTDGFKLSGPIPPILFGGLPAEEAAKLAPFNRADAKKLLAEAGYPNGFDITLTTTDGYGPAIVNAAQWIQQDLKEVGINATLRILDYATWFSTWASEDYQIGYSLSSAFLTADEWLSSYYLSTGARNWFNINDPKLDAMIIDQRGILDRDKREAALLEINRYIEKNISNPVMTYSSNGITVQQPYVHDWWPHPEFGASWVKNMWLGPESPSK